MKMLFSTSDFSEITAVRKILLKAGIPCEIFHDAMSPAMLEMAVYPELWVEDDEDFLAASVLLASVRRNSACAFPPAAFRQTREESLSVQL